MSGPEDNPADEHQPTKAEWDAAHRYHDATINYIESAIIKLKAANGRDDVQAAIKRDCVGATDLGDLIDQLEGMVEHWRDAAIEEEGPCERYERLAELFYRKTGLMAPGKDAPPGFGGSMDARRAAWDTFIDAHTLRRYPDEPCMQPSDEGTMVTYADHLAALKDGAPQWIAMVDEEPKRDGRYLVVYHSGERIHQQAFVADWTVNYGWSNLVADTVITHWQPITKLPPPPARSET